MRTEVGDTPPFRHTVIRAEVPPSTLCWRGDTLVDWVRGGDTWTLDGTFVDRHRRWGYRRFDGAITDETGDWAVVFERCGTPALLLRDGEVHRRLHRDSYQADAYLYPVCLFRGPGGRTLLAHCPDTYDRIELDDALTGERLTRSDRRAPTDFFHSRLTASPDGRRL